MRKNEVFRWKGSGTAQEYKKGQQNTKNQKIEYWGKWDNAQPG